MTNVAAQISRLGLLLIALTAPIAAAQSTRPTTSVAETRLPLVITGGHETDPRDGGRPVVLVAGGLGVPEEVFRDAFKGVHPAGPGRGPTPDEARANKKVLMDALRPYGITNDRLDEVSNRYRYVRSRGELWQHTEAEGYATVRDGRVTEITLTHVGNGYSSPPNITVKDHPEAKVAIKLSYGTDLDRNGSIASASLQN